MPADRLILISDVHLDQWPSDLPDQHEKKSSKFLDFFDWVIDESGAGRLLIAGDLIDVPQKDRQPVLPRYSEIAERIRAVVEAGIKFGYVVGNHDSGLVGLDIELENPPVRVAYPFMLVKSGDGNILVEHGHLHDPWLWDYVRHLAMTMWARDAEVPANVFLWSGAPAVAQATSPAAEASVELARLWQTGANELAVQSPEADRLAQIALQDLAQNYEDVTDPEKDREMLEKRAKLLQDIPAMAPGPGAFSLVGRRRWDWGMFLERMVQTMYSGPHWRRAAKELWQKKSEQVDAPITGVVMGHTHWPDEFSWEQDGATIQYVNSGSWRRDYADIAVIEDGNITLYARDWRDDWPDLT